MQEIDSAAQDSFQKAIESLKLYRRAELVDQKNLIIKNLYVDPLPNDFILKKLLEPNTTFLIGRRGTGKSTIFQRVQYQILGEKNKTSSYIDIKTIFESSQSQFNSSLLSKITNAKHVFDEEQLRKILLYKEFIHDLIREIKEQLKRELDLSLFTKIKSIFYKDLFEKLDNLLASANDDNFQSILGVQNKRISEVSTKSKDVRLGGEISHATTKIHGERDSRMSKETKINFSDVLIRYFNIKEYINSLKEILDQGGIRNLYVFIDDFSELPKDAMEIVVDTLLAPLNNWSDEFIKFKIAAYPNRIYFGEIDKTKIDEVYLDSYKLYANGNPSREIPKGIEFTKRLLCKRIEYYCDQPIEYFFVDQEQDTNDIWKTLYEATMGNPRMLGYLLNFAHESNLLHQEKIDSKSINMASERYFNEKIESYFQMRKFIHTSFQEKSSIFSLKELLEKFIIKSKNIAKLDDAQGLAPSGHFYINQELDPILLTLELNFFLTKRQECLDRDKKKVSIYCFNFGLCQKFGIVFGEPDQHDYFTKRIFDFSPTVQEYIQQNQELICNSCQAAHDFSKLEAIKAYNWLCPECRSGKCELINSSKKYEKEINKIDKELLLPETEMGILKTLHDEDRPQFAKDVAMELDCSYQLVGKRASKLHERELIIRKKNKHDRTEYQISGLGKNSYFPDGKQEVIHIKENK